MEELLGPVPLQLVALDHCGEPLAAPPDHVYVFAASAPGASASIMTSASAPGNSIRFIEALLSKRGRPAVVPCPSFDVPDEEMRSSH